MNRVFLSTILLIFLGILSGCATRTYLKTKVEYSPVSPPKVRLKCDVNLPKDKISPLISISLDKETLEQKVRTDFYEVHYKWANRVSGILLTGASIFTAVKWWNVYSVDTTEEGEEVHMYYPRYLGIIGAIVGLVFIFDSDKQPFPPEQVQEKQLIKDDTIYTATPLTQQSIVITSLFGNESKTVVTDENGKAEFDVRDFYESCPLDSSLILKVSTSKLSTKIIIPNSYVKKVKDYETEAVEAFNRAQTAEKMGKYNKAINYYNVIIRKYPKAKPASDAREKISILQEKIRAQKVAQIRKRLERVSKAKVQKVIRRLKLSESESNALAEAIEYLSSYDDVVSVVKKGLKMPLSDDDAYQEYGNLTLYQKFYAILCYKDYLGKGATKKLSDMLYISNSTAEKLCKINPKNLLR